MRTGESWSRALLSSAGRYFVGAEDPLRSEDGAILVGADFGQDEGLEGAARSAGDQTHELARSMIQGSPSSVMSSA